MDPAIVVFGFGIGVLVGMTGMGGASLMTPLLILIFKTEPVTAIGTDIFYAAVTKTVGGFQHLQAGTVHKGLAFWMAVGSVPSAIGGVFVIELLKDAYGEDTLEQIVFGILGATLLVVGISTLLRTIFIPDVIKERFALHLQRRHIIAAVATGLITGFVIGLTSAGSGTLIGIILIAVFRLTPQRVVGTDIFHAAVLLWAAGAAHWVGGNVDFGLAGNILLGSIPGVLVGGRLALKTGKNLLRAPALGRPDRLGDHPDDEGRRHGRRDHGDDRLAVLRDRLHLHPAPRGEAAARRGGEGVQAGQRPLDANPGPRLQRGRSLQAEGAHGLRPRLQGLSVDLVQASGIDVVDEPAHCVAVRQERRVADPRDRPADARLDVGERLDRETTAPSPSPARAPRGSRRRSPSRGRSRCGG